MDSLASPDPQLVLLVLDQSVTPATLRQTPLLAMLRRGLCTIVRWQGSTSVQSHDNWKLYHDTSVVTLQQPQNTKASCCICLDASTATRQAASMPPLLLPAVLIC